ncbi:RBR-type E3 ubiquitin transferase [Caenorhabditis elegans]|uniref:RBR-type E3 ubiquitin transferase n=2 Tax=Caenorhabditis elegans TaxID=6239 RepID=A8DJA6_CAEEL|nr:RBR-type E3 ubiquitin transferase [Caenorhabditis elegans]CCD64725.1 RBR-type E3 ubiquitin transferase [Caenorhabditis elegans]|eukprot:NP_001040825.2 RBR-type E3 ubiquitin transferase [Caenorhabditis elegans]
MQSEARKLWISKRSLSEEGPSVEIGFEALKFQEESGAMKECELCCEMVPAGAFCQLINCRHVYCRICIRKYMELSILGNRVEIPCPGGCPAVIHPNDVTRYLLPNTDLISKYESFSIRMALCRIQDVRWCPAPDCGFAVIVPNGQKCPRIKCQRPGCGREFCFKCRKVWHEGTRTCSKTFEQLKKITENDVSAHPCPRCKTLIVKENDGSCNHMHCTLCGAEFCWLCLKEINDLHYMSPTGCTFWGKKQWSNKKRLLWQIGSLIGSPVVIAATAVISVPLITGMIPFSVGKRVYKRLKNQSKAKRVISTAAAVTTSAIVSPAIAGVAVAIGVPFALGYTYIMVPKALVHDVVDYVQKKKRREVPIADTFHVDGYHGATMSLAPPPEPEPEHRNADGSAPGPSSVTSSDYSEDFSSSSGDDFN